MYSFRMDPKWSYHWELQNHSQSCSFHSKSFLNFFARNVFVYLSSKTLVCKCTRSYIYILVILKKRILSLFPNFRPILSYCGCLYSEPIIFWLEFRKTAKYNYPILQLRDMCVRGSAVCIDIHSLLVEI